MEGYYLDCVEKILNNKYYHFYPTCPNKGCHEPHNSGEVLESEEEGEILHCAACGTTFCRHLDLLIEELDTFWGIKKIGRGARKRIFWSALPNTLEQEYIDWACANPIGNFLVTWPWKDVRFIPMLASEYAYRNGNFKIAIICRLTANDDLIAASSAYLTFENMLMIDEKDVRHDLSMKKILSKSIEANMIKKQKNVNYKSTNTETGKVDTRVFYGVSVNRIKQRIRREFEEEHGYSINKIHTRKEGTENTEVIDENSAIEISLWEREEFSGTLSYDRNSELEVLSSESNVHYPSQEIPNTIIRNIRNIQDYENNYPASRIIFLQDDCSSDTIFSVISKPDVRIVIFENIDDFIKNSIYFRDKKSHDLVKFIKGNENSDKTILMFSPNPELRYLRKKYLHDNLYFDELITIHTYDTQKRLETLFMSDWVESRYPNPCSSLKAQALIKQQLPHIEYRVVEELDKLFEGIDYLLQKLYTSQDIRRYFRDMRKTPLLFTGDFRKQEVFKRNSIVGDLTFNSVMFQIMNIDKNIYDSLLSLEDSYFYKNRDTPSPIFNDVLKIIEEYIADSQLEITLVTHPQDVHGFKRLLLNTEAKESLHIERISVCSWSSDLLLRSQEIRSSDKKHLLISTEPPDIGFNLYNLSIDVLIFVGSAKNLDKFREILEKHVTEQYLRPISFLRKGENSPLILKTIEDRVRDLESSYLEIKEDELVPSSVIKMEEISRSYIEHYVYPEPPTEQLKVERYIEANEEAIAAIKGKECMLLPIGAIIHYKESIKSSKILEIKTKIDLDSVMGLKEGEIFIGRGGTYRSLKIQFAEAMIEIGKNIKIESGTFIWNNFVDLLYDSIAWINYLSKAKNFINENLYHRKCADDELAEKIINMQTSARDPEYVKTWWQESEGDISIDQNIVKIPITEHPRNVNDIKKIYELINEIIPSLHLSEDDAIKSYNAALIIQRLRQSVLSGNHEDLLPHLKKVYMILRPIILEIWEKSNKFPVERFERIKLKKRTIAYKVIPIEEL